MIILRRTDSENVHFKTLVEMLDAALRILDGDEHVFYASLNKTDSLNTVVVAYHENEFVGCGALRHYSEGTVEIKRMYVLPECRGKGIASKILTELEQWALELHYKKCILETGIRQLEALGLYPKMGYKVIPNYGKYDGQKSSVCFEKVIGSEL